MPKRVNESRRVLACGIAGLAGAALISLFAPWQAGVIVGWNIAAFSLLTWLKRELWSLDPIETKAFSSRDDDSRATAAAVVIIGSLASLVAVILGVIEARAAGGWVAVATIIASVCSVAASFAVVNSTFALTYLHAYFDGLATSGSGGLRFPDDAQPRCSDFVYFAFTVGMSFAVSDVEVIDSGMRRRILGHALVSYAFASAILGFAINLVASLLG